MCVCVCVCVCVCGQLCRCVTWCSPTTTPPPPPSSVGSSLFLPPPRSPACSPAIISAAARPDDLHLVVVMQVAPPLGRLGPLPRADEGVGAAAAAATRLRATATTRAGRVRAPPDGRARWRVTPVREANGRAGGRGQDRVQYHCSAT